MSLSVNARESAGGVDARTRSENQLPCPSSGFADVYRRPTEPDAEDAMEIRAVRKACTERDVGYSERAAGRVRQQPVQLQETPLENVLVERLGRLLEQTVNLARCDPEQEPDSLSAERSGKAKSRPIVFSTASVRAALRPRPLMSSSESRSAPIRQHQEIR